MPIDTPRDLQEHLELAIQVELATVPPYLYAMYSIEDQASEAALLIRSIVAEEMLHAALATNVLLAVGGDPRFDTTELMPTYPGFLPHHRPPLELNLQPCSLDLVRQVFMVIERPEAPHAPPEPDVFETLGQFYHALEVGLTELSERYDLFGNPQADRQLSDPAFYRPVAYDAEDSGGLVLVDGLESALEALEIIVHQGEGLSTERWADPAHQELTHYYKLLQIAEGTTPLGTVRPLRSNPQSADYPLPLRRVSNLFNAGYRYLYFVLGDLFGGSTDRAVAVRRLYVLMNDVLSPLARFLVQQPVGGGLFAGPTFEVHGLDPANPLEGLAALADDVTGPHPELSDIDRAIGALRA